MQEFTPGVISRRQHKPASHAICSSCLVATWDSAQSISSQSGSGDHMETDRTVASAAAGHILNTRPAPLHTHIYTDKQEASPNGCKFLLFIHLLRSAP